MVPSVPQRVGTQPWITSAHRRDCARIVGVVKVAFIKLSDQRHLVHVRRADGATPALSAQETGPELLVGAHRSEACRPACGVQIDGRRACLHRRG
jgi:hypothetical protein